MTVTDEAKALVFVLRRGEWNRELCKYVPTPELTQAADLIETQAREIERLTLTVRKLQGHQAAMEAKLAKWKALAETLAGYASHKPDCRYEQMFAYEQPCTCGLPEALTNYKGQRDD